MCGIAGIIGLGNKDQAGNLIKQMTQKMAHRGPDADGHFVDEGIALGHRRLSIIDLNPESNQPFLDNSGNYAMVFNGEIYNYLEVKKELSDYDFKTKSDTEVVLAAYIKWGAQFLNKLNGMFALAIWDKREKTLFTARDRVGIKPFYYYQKDGLFLFSSEIRSILASDQIPKKINKNAVVDFLNYQAPQSPLSIIENVHQLESGTYAIWKDGVFKTHRFWNIATPYKNGLEYDDEKKVQKNIERLLLESVERRMIADVPLGAFLSGGIDSSGIVALMSEISEKPINTFAVVFNEKEYDESEYSSLVAKKYNTEHHPILLKPEQFLEELPNALNSMDTPTGDGPNSYVVSKVTKEAGITVALSGLGGDELFAGYPVFNQLTSLNKYSSFWMLPTFLRKTGAALLSLKGQNHKSERLKDLMTKEDFSFEKIYPTFRKLSSKTALKSISESLPFAHNTIESILKKNKNYIEDLPFLSKITVGEMTGYTQNVLLKDSDQMSMASALELRVPFFDHTLIEYVMNVPDKIKFPKYSKSLLVESLAPRLPDEIVHRKKMGFSFPYEYWMKKELKSFCEEKVNGLAKRSLFNGGYLEDLWQRFLKGDPKIMWVNVWLIVVLENWLQTNGIDG